jgi:hypothetical protein
MNKCINIILIILSINFLTGCGTDIDGLTFDIERDGDVMMITYAEFDGTITYPEITNETVTQELEYLELPDRSVVPEWDHDKFEINQQTFEENNGVVDSSIYPYIFVVPIKSKQDIFSMKTNENRFKRDYFAGWSCYSNRSRQVPALAFLPGIEPILDQDGYYHYKLYVESNRMAQYYFFNEVNAICLSYKAYSDGQHQSSNTIVIDEQEVKDVLDTVGIGYILTTQ